MRHQELFRRQSFTGMPKILLAAVLAAAAMASTPAARAAEIDQQAINRAHQFLRTKDTGEFTLNFVHMYTDYHGHEYLRTLAGSQGRFELVYRYFWADDGITDIGFDCDAHGNVDGVEIEYTNAEVNQPFLFAKGSLTLLSELIIRNSDNLSRADREYLRSLVRDADIRGLLVWGLQLKQAGR